MIALLGSLLGFSTSFLPQVLGLFTAKQEHKNKIELMTLQAKMASQGIDLQIKVLDKQAEIEEQRRFIIMLTLLADFQQGYPLLCALLSPICFLVYSWPQKS
jgi:hypothetical protein